MQREVLLNSILENCQDIITVVDLNFNYINCNRAFLKLMKFIHESNVRGRNIKEILPCEAYETVAKNLAIMLDTREPVEYTFNINNKRQVLSQLSTPIVENGEITGILSVARNITNEESLKLKLVEKICELNSLLETKRQLEAQKELFMATLTHDLKNPVQAQIMSLKMLKGETLGNLNQKQNYVLDTLLESSNYMNDMLYSILKTYKYDNGAIILNKSSIYVTDLIEKCINEVSAFAQSRQIKIILNIQNINLYADAKQLRRVIGNLINNALNYAYKNSEIKIDVGSKDNNMIFKISNKGKPIRNCKNIFEKFYTGDNLKGIGLGLYYSKKVIEGHNGRIYLKSEGENTSFIFEIPLNSLSENAKISLV